MTLLRTAVPALLLLASVQAAEQPLGVVEQIASDQATLRFDVTGGMRLLPGSMVALYGAGTVEKHPLTGEVIITRPALAAKAQLLAPTVEGRWQARLRWRAPGATVTPGYDAVPLPGEAAPNAPPVAGTMKPLAVAAGDRVDLTLAVRDPDGDALHFRWSLEGSAGATGTLADRVTTQPTVSWLAPLVEGTVTAVAVATDSLGQSTTLRLPITVAAPTSLPTGKREALGAWGNSREPALLRLHQGPTGTWWGVTAAVGMTGAPGLTRFQPALALTEALTFAPEAAPRKPVGILDRGTDLVVLDAGRSHLCVYTPTGALLRSHGPFERAVGLAAGPDGTLYVADAADRGIHVLEADGRYRCRLGRTGGEDGLSDIAAVAVALDGTVVALDPAKPALVRFNRFGKRLDAWACPGDPKDPAIDLVLHPRLGALVLLTSGKVVPVTADGLREPLADPAVAAGEATGRGLSLSVDAAGNLYGVRENGVVVRWGADLAVAGIRSSTLRGGDALAADGLGRTYALDHSSGTITVTDAEGWQTARLPSGAKAPVALAATADGRWLAIVDKRGRCVIRLDLTAPTRPGLVIGQEGTYDGQFKAPIAAAFDASGRLYVLDADLYRVAVFGTDGTFTFNVGARKILEDPEQVAVSPDGSLLYVYDSDNYEIKRFRLDHAQRSASSPSLAGGKGSAPGQFRSVVAIGCDRRGLLYAADDSRDDLQVFDFRGNACTLVHQDGLSDLDLTDVALMAVHPDGRALLGGGGRWTAWRW